MTIRRPNISLPQLRAFAGVIEAGTFTAAADDFGVTQSGLSQSVSGLEDALGVVLLKRDRDGLRPTGIGAEVLGDALAALRAVERMHQRCAAFRGLVVGTLRIGAVASAASRILPEALKAHCDQNPALKVEMFEGTDPEVAEWTMAGVVDVGFSAETGRGLVDTVVAEDEYVAVLPSGHELTTPGRIALRRLGKEPFVMPGASCEPPIRAMFAAVGVTPNVVCTVRGTASLIDMVRAGVGVTIVPELSLPEAPNDFSVSPFKPPIKRKLLAIRDKEVEPTPTVAALLSTLEATRS